MLERLGSGTMGTVDLAEDLTAQGAARRVALKRLKPERVEREDEFRAIPELDHPHFATACDFGYAEGERPYDTPRYVAGAPLPPGPRPHG